MAATLIYIDTFLYQNQPLKESLERQLKAAEISIQSIHFLEQTDISLANKLQNLLNEASLCCIAASSKAFPLVSRILATLKDDILVATGNTLHPATASIVKPESYLLHFDTTPCNVLMVKPYAKAPDILLQKSESKQTWQLFGSEEHLKKIKQLAFENQFAFDFFQVIEGWCEIETQSAFQIDKMLPHGALDSILLLPANNIFDACIRVLSHCAETITFAESCTGGLIAASLTARSGSSDILKGSVVSYANSIKHQWLEVESTVLENPGAVSMECVIQMANGAKELAKSDIALAVSGIAGPTGGTPLKPVGTVYIAAANSQETRSKHLLLQGDRNYIQNQAMMHSLKLLIELEREKFYNYFKNS